VTDLVDLRLVMSVNPGWGGRSHSAARTRSAVSWRSQAAGRIDIEVDGGVTADNAACDAPGANALVAGSAVFKGGPSAYRANIDAIRNAAAAGPWRSGLIAIISFPHIQHMDAKDRSWAF